MNQTFILKNKSQEHYLLEEQRAHIKKMQQIKSNSSLTFRKSNSFIEIPEQRQTNKRLTNDHIKLEKVKEVTKKHKQRSKTLETEHQINSVHMKRLRQIDIENEKLAKRLLTLQPTLETKSELDRQYKSHKKMKKIVKRFHVLKPFEGFKPTYPSRDQFDLSNPELMKERVHLYIHLKKFDASIIFKQQQEKFSLEIQGRDGLLKTQPEYISEFSKTAINEYFSFEELQANSSLHVIFKVHWNDEEAILGEIDLDLRPYYLENGVHNLDFDLLNKQGKDHKHYFAPEFRRNGFVTLQLKVQSSLKKYLLDQQPEGSQSNHGLQSKKSIQLPQANRKSLIQKADEQHQPSLYTGRLHRKGLETIKLMQLNSNQQTKIQTAR